MRKEEIREVLKLYNEFDRNHPITASFVEHADSDDWGLYWNGVVNYIKKKLVPPTIDEDKLDEMAKDSWNNLQKLASAQHITDGWNNYIYGFEAGYRKAKEE